VTPSFASCYISHNAKNGKFQFFAGFSMELTPLDIRNQSFHKKNFNGIDAEEVKAFLETAANAFEQMSRDKTDLTERLKVAEERVNYYRQIEKTIQDAVVTMQKTVDEVKATAEKEAEIIVAEAKARAVREVESTKKEAEELRMEIEQLKQLRTNYFIRCIALIRGQEELLTAMENDQRMQEELMARPVSQGNVLA
jgi:cell division initiation protein